MANFRIGVPQDLRDQLAIDLKDIRTSIAEGTLPAYPNFVNNLAKGMNTPAEELHHATTGMAGEAGELLDASKKVWIYNKKLDLANLIEELGDLRFYYQAALNMLGLTDEDIQVQNMRKLRVRYADGKYSDAQAQARADKAPPPLSAAGAKGTATPEPRKFMGQPATPRLSARICIKQRVRVKDGLLKNGLGIVEAISDTFTLTVRLTEAIGAYAAGDTVHLQPYEVEPT